MGNKIIFPVFTKRRRHGQAKSKLYKTWVSMRNRCNNPKNIAYSKYGGRGIKVCERWNSFQLFAEDMGEPPEQKSSIERKDNSKDYEPGNCCWATPKEQARNRRTSRMIEHNGITKTLKEWSESTGLGSVTITTRIDICGWSVADALTKPARGWAPGRPKKS